MNRLAHPFIAGRSLHLRARRGFTLIEMMVVVVIIGLFAALAAPSVISQVRDQRARRQAISIVDIFRDARARALGRGTAININYQLPGAGEANALQSDFIIQQAVNASLLPNPYCTQTTWTNVDSQVIAQVRPGVSTTGPGVLLGASYYNSANTPTATTNLNVCFTPSGRIFFEDLPLEADGPPSPAASSTPCSASTQVQWGSPERFK